MNDQTAVRLLVSGGLALLGLAFLAYTVWARRGGSPRAREWMGNEWGARPNDERMTVLGAPMMGIVCLCAAASALPVIGLYLMIVAVPLGVLCLGIFIASAMWFIPLPDIIYPHWARPLRARNRASEKAVKEWLRKR